jgi:glycyl-tRNA synthetase
VGIADRSCFDLNAHADATKTDLQYKQMLEKPIEAEVLALTKQSGITVMKAFKKDGKMVKEWLETLPQEQLKDVEKDVSANGSKEVEIGSNKFTLLKEQLTFEKKIEKTTVRSFTPGVIEPSFGIDRIFFSMLEHSYYARPKDDSSDDKQIRGVLSFAPQISPYKLSILPLDQRVSRDDKYKALLSKLRQEMSSVGLSYTIDESSATIGRRYSRNDELGVPFALTCDFQTLEDNTATLRARDAMDQLRCNLDSLVSLIRDLCAGEITWAEAKAKFPTQ